MGRRRKEEKERGKREGVRIYETFGIEKKKGGEECLKKLEIPPRKHIIIKKRKRNFKQSLKHS